MTRILLTAARRAIRKIVPFTGCLLFLAGCATRDVSQSSPPVNGVPVPVPPPDAQRGAPAGPITLEEALERAAACSPQIRALTAAVTLAKQRRSAASDFEDPEALAAWGDINDQFGNSGTTSSQAGQWRTGGRVYVPNPFLVVPRVSARTADYLAAKADLEVASWRVGCEVRRSFAELNYLGEDTALAEELVRQTGEILKDVRLRAGQGAATASDVVAAGQKQLQAQNDLDVTRHRYHLAQRDLAALLDLPPASLRVATNAWSQTSVPGSGAALDALESVALRCRGDIAAFRWRTLAARSAYREARNARIPWVHEVTTWHREPVDQWWVELGVKVPIFSWAKNHTDDVLLAQWSLAGVNETNGMQLVRREIRDALDELKDRRQQQLRNQSEVGPLLAEMRRTLQVLRSTPTLMPSQVAATEAQILESSRLELASRWQYQLAVLNLERAIGEPLPDALDSITTRK